jgi:undecaprenyl diphosphate synthase
MNNALKHVAIIPDGNGRWALARGLMRTDGHRLGVKVAQRIMLNAIKFKIPYLTFFCFSKNNGLRPVSEVTELMSLLIEQNDHIAWFLKHRMRCYWMGDAQTLAPNVVEAFNNLQQQTASETALSICFAVNYTGRWDITQACARCLKTSPSKIPSEEDLQFYLKSNIFPDPDLLIRTGCEKRLSQFLVWSLAYTELYFSNTLWPNFGTEHFKRALFFFKKRQRRFGAI